MSNKVIDNWMKVADYDFATAVAMQKSGRYIYVAFTCEQCIEKLFKALYVKIKGETPPYTHNLVRLAEITGTDNELESDKKEFIAHLNAYYIKTRYSEDVQNWQSL